MNLYTHYYLAQRLEGLLRPADPAEYAWGAVIPDIRYLAGLPRKQTHVPVARVKSWLECYPERKSFAQGYLVHCLLDQIDVAGVLAAAFPMRLLRQATRRRLSPPQATMLVEVYYTRQKSARQPVGFSGTHNEILAELGVLPEQTDAYAATMRDYLSRPTLENSVCLARRFGLLANSQLEKYLGAAQSLQKNQVLLLPMLWSVRNAQFERRGERLIAEFL